MNGPINLRAPAAALLLAAWSAGACGSADTKASEGGAAAPATVVAVEPVAASEQALARFIRVTGTLTAEELAAVAAETAGRVIATPVERGTAVNAGAELIRLSPIESDAQAKEAEANAAQIAARLGLVSGRPFDANAVPEVANAKASLELAQADFDRFKALLEERVVSRAEYDQRRAQVEAARQQLEIAKNAAAQQYQLLLAARAREIVAKKVLADTVVRAPFTGLVGERMVSVGDYVTKGMKIAVVVRINPLRVRLTVPEQFVSSVTEDQPVAFEVDAYPGRRFEGRVRYVSPTLHADQRALTVEAVVPNPGHELKPGFFATAQIQQAETKAIVVPAGAVRTTAGTSHVFVISGGKAEDRIVTIGQAVGSHVEVVSGLKAGEQVATTNVVQLADGMAVSK